MSGPTDGGWLEPGNNAPDETPTASPDPAAAAPGSPTALVPRVSSVPTFGKSTDVVEAAGSDVTRALPSVRRESRVGPPPRDPQWMINQLPVGMLQSDFFVRFVSIFQELGSKLLDDADLVQHVPDASVTPVPMISHLASWIGVDNIDVSLPEPLQRVILASSAKALARRGTVDGLRGYLEMLSGGPAEVVDGGGVWAEGGAPRDVAWVRMTVHGTGHLSEDEFVAMVRDEVPAHVRAELWVDVRRVLSTAQDAAKS
ncbi:phage tail protein domain-containing protein [Nakamurella panacisegetis]|uniref:Phage tail protein domain-containing protein n=1 Tax=Nakamurella panacisegetis TaxID=1090615 RepID=A0A1H0JHV9_9ACTN|nr:phage tail protein [Nakamurella panacisegetis]SDO43385.1 phage tail protein domain-containing protein [Nakamurella panacisegetis]